LKNQTVSCVIGFRSIHIVTRTGFECKIYNKVQSLNPSSTEKTKEMGSGKAEKPSKNPKKKRKPLAPNRAETKPKSKSKREKNRADLIESKSDNVKSQEVQAAPAAEQQFSFFVHQFQSANKVQLSSLELDSMKGNFRLTLCLVSETL
jgi:hypothetical protein